MFTVGRLAKQVDLNIETIRYYQRIGLLRTPDAEDGYRFYNQQDVARLKFIKRVKQAGLHLHEIAELLSLDYLKDQQRQQDIVNHYQQALAQRITELRNLQLGLANWQEDIQQSNSNSSKQSIVQAFNYAPTPPPP